jgi:hypothetical protein
MAGLERQLNEYAAREADVEKRDKTSREREAETLTFREQVQLWWCMNDVCRCRCRCGRECVKASTSSRHFPVFAPRAVSLTVTLRAWGRRLLS